MEIRDVSIDSSSRICLPLNMRDMNIRESIFMYHIIFVKLIFVPSQGSLVFTIMLVTVH